MLNTISNYSISCILGGKLIMIITKKIYLFFKRFSLYIIMVANYGISPLTIIKNSRKIQL